MKTVLLILSTFFTLLFLAGCGGEEAKTIIEDNKDFKELKAVGNKNYKLTTTDGQTIDFKVGNDYFFTTKDTKLEKKYVLFNFWATWCAPCIKEMPVLTKVQEDNASNLQIVGVLIEKNKDPKELADFMTKFKMNFPVTIGDENYRMAKAFDDVKMFPESFLFAPDGKLLKHFVGEITIKDVESYIK